MVTIDFLINDEREAIAGYNNFLRQGTYSPKTIKVVKKIIADEKKHIVMLNKLKKMKNL